MTDREMLELAASAAGYVFGEYGGKPARQVTTKIGAARIYWNPLTDDGDALRLAVQCGILNLDDALFYGDRDIDYQTDPYAATRRAITRAAAEIGRQMEVTT